jgi:hypothetical protein
MFHQYGDNPVDKDYCPLPSRRALRDWAMSIAGPTPEPSQPTPPTPTPVPPRRRRPGAYQAIGV